MVKEDESAASIAGNSSESRWKPTVGREIREESRENWGRMRSVRATAAKTSWENNDLPHIQIQTPDSGFQGSGFSFSAHFLKSKQARRNSPLFSLPKERICQCERATKSTNKNFVHGVQNFYYLSCKTWEVLEIQKRRGST